MFNWRNSPNRAEFRERVVQIKLGFGCMDCGWRESAEALEFDHIGDNKVDSVSKLAAIAEDWRTVVDEMVKCEVVCVRCHRIRTVARQRTVSVTPQAVAEGLLEQMRALAERAERAAQVAEVAANRLAERQVVESVPPLLGPVVTDVPRSVDGLTQVEADAALALLLRQMWSDGQYEVQLSEVASRFPHRHVSWLSRKLSAVAAGAAPLDGLTLERTDVPGRYVLAEAGSTTQGDQSLRNDSSRDGALLLIGTEIVSRPFRPGLILGNDLQNDLRNDTEGDGNG